MHRCLNIADIVGEICSQVECFPVKYADATLSALARTSSVFHNPALDLLWHSQDTLENFFRCLPPDLVAFDEDNAGTGQKRKVVVRLLRPIVSSDWDRSRLYAHRARQLFWHSDSLSLSQIFPELSISLPDDVLFPNLRALEWWVLPEDDFHHINLFLARTLTKISIRPSSAFQLSVLSTLPRRCPALETLEIRGDFPPPASDCFLLAQLPHLKSLNISVDDIATVEVIGKLQNLTDLTLRYLLEHLSSSVIYTSRFSNVRQIYLDFAPPKAATEFFKMCMDASLTSVTVDFDSRPTTSELNQLCASLESCRHSHLSLTSLFLVYLYSDVVRNIASYAVDSATFRILFCFKNLTEVYINAVSFDLDDAVLLEMARSWPQLESLNLKLHTPPQPNHVTLHSLRSLARHCPDLRKLSMTFDASVIPLPDTSGAHILQTSLTTIEPHCSPILDPFQVARFISGIFPHDNNGTAEEVKSHIPTIMAIREEGRMWAQSALAHLPTRTY
ncbi:hypothetical protein B0H14DRAFT_2941984 [Mycena olivaceomarginata]|nr:hypothetical protein B0H14DRAFT_2941984 [Mycena olivaceomarginata]